MAQTQPPLTPLVLRLRRGTDLIIFGLSSVFLTLGTLAAVLPDPDPDPVAQVAGLLIAVPALLIAAASFCAVINPGTLVLDEFGFRQLLPTNRRSRIELWITGDDFCVYRTRGRTMITYTRRGLVPALEPGSPQLDEVLRLCRSADGSRGVLAARRGVRRLQDQERFLPANYGRLNPEELADLLNRYQNAFGRGPRPVTTEGRTRREAELAFLLYLDGAAVLAAYRRAFGKPHRDQNP